MSDEVLQRIEGWQAAGLIDEATAERLRAAELTAEPVDPKASAEPRPGFIASFFGPSISIVEAFSYLGGAFLLASWTALIVRVSGDASDPTRQWIYVAGAAIPAAVFFILGLTFHGRSARLNRAAGVAYFLSAMLIWGGVTLNVAIFANGSVPPVAGAAAGLVAALAYRWLHPSVLTQFAVLTTLTGLVQSTLVLLQDLLFPRTVTGFGDEFVTIGLSGALLASAAWLGCAIVIGLIALAEARSEDPAAARRAALARLWAGIVAVSGVAYSLMRTEYDGTTSQRVVEPWIADLVVLAVSAVLIERAFRREAASYVLAAAFGVVIALTDFNLTYFAPNSSTEVALLVEGLLLMALAFAAERVTRRISGRATPAATPAVADAAEGASS